MQSHELLMTADSECKHVYTFLMTTCFMSAPRYILDIKDIKDTKQIAAGAAVSAPVISAQGGSKCKPTNNRDSTDARRPT